MSLAPASGIATASEVAASTQRLQRVGEGRHARTSSQDPDHSHERPPSRMQFSPLLRIGGVVICATAALSAMTGPSPFLLPFLLLGPGIALLAVLPRQRVTALVLVPSLSIGVLILASTLMITTGWWHPLPTTAGAALLCGAVLALSLRGESVAGLRRIGGGATTQWRRRCADLGASKVGCIALAFAVPCWALAVAEVDVDGDHPWGLLVSSDVALAVTFALLLSGFLLGVRRRSAALVAAATAGTIVWARGTAVVALDAPTTDWAYKHLGVVDLFASQGSVSPELDIYQSWPGFFSAVAHIQAVTGISAFEIAIVSPLCVTVLSTAAVVALARALGADRLTALVAGNLAVLANWVAQDYFSPQSIAFPIAVVVLALLVRSSRDVGAGALALALFAALVLTHQLTPYWVIAAAIAAVALRRLPWWWAVLLVAIAGAQVLLHFDVVADYGIFSGSNVVENARSNADRALGSPELSAHSNANRVASLLLWGGAAATVLPHLRRSRFGAWLRSPDAVASVIAFSPFGILLAQSYGGEAVLRVLLYSVPGCAILIAPRLVAALGAPHVRAAIASGVLVCLALSSAHAYFATWYHYAVTAAEYRAEVMLSDEVPAKAYLSPVSAYWPVRASASYAWRLEEDAEFDVAVHTIGGGPTDPDYVADLERNLENRDAPTFLLYGPRMDAYAEYRGLAPRGTLDVLVAELSTRPGWDVVWQQDGVTVLRYVPRGMEYDEAATWTP